MEEKDRRFIRILGVLSTVGITMVAATVIGLFIGHWLDGVFGTQPWLTAIFFLLGVIAGFRNLYQAARKAQQTMDETDKRPDKEREDHR
ncbi:MAG: AtpZ/AtpI family protein [Nitrospiraceae bacterium]|nr:AtpZ/AtpI family protein [Nitrospiraceae bacterium]